MAGGSGTHPISGSDMALWGKEQTAWTERGGVCLLGGGSWTHPLLFFLRSWGPKDKLFPCPV